MNRLDPADVEGSLRTMEAFLWYMQERLEFNNANMVRNISAAGVSTVEVLTRLVALENTVSMLASVVNGYSARINGLETRLGDAESEIDALGARTDELAEAAGRALDEIDTINESIAALDARVTALEEREE